MSITTLELQPKPPFDWRATVTSHGWLDLPPFAWDGQRQILRRIERLDTGAVVRLSISADGSGPDKPLVVAIEHEGTLAHDDMEKVRAMVASMLRLDEDFSAFYALCRQHGEAWEGATHGYGRLLRAPTLFEDAVKVICTTNIQWGGTRRMIRTLVETYGEPFPGVPALKAFPAPGAIAAETEERFAEVARMGYRAPYVHRLALKIADGQFDLETLRASSLPTPALRKELLKIDGVGPYAAASLLMLLGRYDEIAVDTELRRFVPERYFGGERRPDAELVAVYADWGAWKYLAYGYEVWQYYQAKMAQS